MKFSEVKILAHNTHPVFGEQLLQHHTAGSELAGSGTRETAEKWTFAYVMKDGTAGSRAYKTLDAARAEYVRCTGLK
jgi:hypothetical protein